MPPSPLTRLRKICLAFAGAHEVEAWGAPTFRVKNKLFAMYAEADNHHGAGHQAVWIKSTAINQGFVLKANPRRYFSPPYVGPSGWIGAKLDGRVNWTELTELLRDGYELAAPPPSKRATRTTTRTTTRTATRRTTRKTTRKTARKTTKRR